jgi:DUF4097 and DUF4098 domain-containing protein YvlB
MLHPLAGIAAEFVPKTSADPAMTRFRLALILTLALASSTALAQDSIEKVNGSITAEAGRTYGGLSTVNGSITIEDRVKAGDAGTVNGGIRGGDDVEAEDLATVNGSIRFGERLNLRGGIETVNGSVFLDSGGRVGRNITTVNGAIGLVRTELAGGIETVNGDITVGIGSHVRGGIKVHKPGASWMPIQFNKRKPRIVIGPEAVVEGPLVFEREVTLYVHESARIGEVTGATAVKYSGNTAPKE